MEATLVGIGKTVGWEEFVASGITYRKLDYWTKNGLLRPVPGRPDGSGYVRRWPAGELDVAILMDRLTRGGLRLAVAHDVARQRSDNGTFACDIAPGIAITVGPEPAEAAPGPAT